MDDNRFRLPKEFASAGDPIEANPFKPSDPRHKVWADATRVAAGEVAQIKSDAPASLTPGAAVAWFTALICAKFNAWAKRGVQVVWTDPAAEAYAQWLINYANAFIDSAAKLLADAPPHLVREQMIDLRNALGQRVSFWTAEALRYRREQIQHEADRSSAPLSRVTPEIINHRKKMVREYRSRHGLTAVAFARKVGVSDTGIHGIIREDRKRFSVSSRTKLLTVLGVHLGDWNRNG